MSTQEARPETNAEYHADTEYINFSMLKVFAKSPKLYYLTFVEKSVSRPPIKPAMILGSVVHSLFLEPEKFGVDYAVAPKCDRRTKAGKTAWSEFADEADGKTVITADVFATATAIVASLNDANIPDNIALDLCNSADKIIESPIRWIDEATGLKLKAKPDIYIPGGSAYMNLCVDLKTTAVPGDGFAKQCAEMGYHRQAAFYLNGCDRVYAHDGETDFLVLAVGNEMPHDFRAYHLGPEWIAAGTFWNEFYLNRLKICYETNEWFSPESRTIGDLKMPKWLKYERIQ